MNWQVCEPDEQPEFPDDIDDLDLVEKALEVAAKEEDLVQATAVIAYEIASAQGFYEGNKRTAYILALDFWRDHARPEHSNVFADNDEEIRDLLVLAAQGHNVKNQLASVLRSRLS